MEPIPRRGLLIVDDDEAYRHALERAARALGFTPFGCASWSEIDEEMAYDPPLVGAILDLQLISGTPNGLSVGQMLRRKNRNLPLVFISSAPELGDYVPPHLGPVVDKNQGLARILSFF